MRRRLPPSPEALPCCDRAARWLAVPGAELPRRCRARDRHAARRRVAQPPRRRWPCGPPVWAGERPFAVAGTRTTPVLATWNAPGKPATPIVALDAEVLDLKVAPDGWRAVAMTRHLRGDGTVVVGRDLLVVDGDRVRRLPLPSEPSSYSRWRRCGAAGTARRELEGRSPSRAANSRRPARSCPPARGYVALDGVVHPRLAGDGCSALRDPLRSVTDLAAIAG